MHGGKVVYERYSPNRADGRSVTMPGFSMAKSVTSALAGILVRDGRLDVDAPAAVGAWQGESDPRRAITLDHLLHMTSGLNWTERPHDTDMFAMLAADDGAAYAADKERFTVVADSEYGAGWWLDPERPGVMYAVGVDGQVITVDPAHDLTVVQLATDGASDISLAVSEAILDAFAASD